jgi:oxalate decarboxylase/phosphoglucose isomerase-like protein (cupin superfamily)
MELIQPWNTSILKANVSHMCNVEAIADEILSLHSLSPQQSTTQYKITPEEFPALCDFRDRVVTNLVKEFVKQTMRFDLTQFTVDTFGKWFEKGMDLSPHTHGSTGITSVFYPADYKSGMTVYDPRGNACRGYPRQIRDDYFAPFYVYPKAGDLIIMPSFLQHYVPTVEDDLRLSLINDYMFPSV